jgi:hypothetical protein
MINTFNSLRLRLLQQCIESESRIQDKFQARRIPPYTDSG